MAKYNGRAKFVVTAGLCGALMLGGAPAAFASDYEGHWNQAGIDEWRGYGVIQGYGDGTFRPDAPVTRAEFVTFLDRTMGYGTMAENTFTDVEDDWYTESLLQGVAAGVIQGDKGLMRPNDPITREEAATILVRVMALDTEGVEASKFTDRDQVSDWALGYVDAASAAGIVNGYADGTFAPGKNVTRAETLRMLDNAFAALYQKGGEYTGDVNASAVVSADGVTLKDQVIAGDLIIAEGVGDGHVVLDGVTVEGRLIVRGAGANSVIIKGDSKISEVIIDRQDDAVRVAVEGKAQVDKVVVAEDTASAKVEGTVGALVVEAPESKTVVAGTVDSVVVEDEAVKAVVRLETAAKAGSVSVAADEATVEVAGEAGTVAVTGDKVAVKAESGSTVEKVTTSGADTAVSGEGDVDSVVAEAGSTGAKVETEDTKVENKGDGDVAIPDGTVVPGGSATTPGGNTSGGGGGGGIVVPHTHTYTDGVCSCGEVDPAWAQVDTVEKWNEAVAAGKSIVLTGDLKASAQLTVSQKIVVNGNGQKVTSTNNADTPGDAAAILVTAEGATVKNLNVVGPNNTASGWDEGEYGIKVYGAKNVTIEDVTVSAANAGIQVNSAEVVLKGTVTVSGNEFGGIEVCKSSNEGMVAGKLTIAADAEVVCADTKVPAVWIDGTTAEAGVVEGADKLYSFNTGRQIYYFTAADNATYPVMVGNALYENLASALSGAESGSTVTVRAAQTISPAEMQARVSGKKLVIDLAQNTLSVTGGNESVTLNGANTDVTFKNGKMEVGTTTTTVANFAIESGAKLTLDGVDGVSYNSSGSCFYPSGKDSTVNIKNSVITTSGVYCVATNAGSEANYGVIISIENSTLKADSADGDNCALCLNVQGDLNVVNSAISGERQAVIVRDGNATFTNCTIEATPVKLVDTEHKYQSPDAWRNGNQMSYGAVIAGNNTATSYKGNVSVKLSGCTITCTPADGVKDCAYAVMAARLNSTEYSTTVTFEGENKVKGTVAKYVGDGSTVTISGWNDVADLTPSKPAV